MTFWCFVVQTANAFMPSHTLKIHNTYKYQVPTFGLYCTYMYTVHRYIKVCRTATWEDCLIAQNLKKKIKTKFRSNWLRICKWYVHANCSRKSTLIIFKIIIFLWNGHNYHFTHKGFLIQCIFEICLVDILRKKWLPTFN